MSDVDQLIRASSCRSDNALALAAKASIALFSVSLRQGRQLGGTPIRMEARIASRGFSAAPALDHA